MKRLREQMNINARLDAVIGAACDVRLPKVPPPDPGDLQWLEKAEHRLRTLLGRQQSELSAEDARDLQVLTYAKERYETRLAAFDDAESVPQAPKDGWAARGLALNDAWMNTLQAGRLDAATVDALRCVISEGDAWLPDCGCSNVQLVERSDRQSARNGVQTDLFGRFSMDDGQARTLTFIAIFFYMAVQVLLLDRRDTDTTPGKPAGHEDASRLLQLFGVPPVHQILLPADQPAMSDEFPTSAQAVEVAAKVLERMSAAFEEAMSTPYSSYASSASVSRVSSTPEVEMHEADVPSTSQMPPQKRKR
ncbi:hypothetical protein M3Y99_01477900 [Aphelenchoides fujianensis]|nr:hypothetical protein M3Y99_01477900 [Aphelenchoides fujianensis]